MAKIKKDFKLVFLSKNDLSPSISQFERGCIRLTKSIDGKVPFEWDGLPPDLKPDVVGHVWDSIEGPERYLKLLQQTIDVEEKPTPSQWIP
mmetsp:Transcript_9351/g.28618  ORF Transcript_9351/g.28618 Transcript_9351/m.28618 type:complete len:91 (+) Transcript_9351:1136-1408(+)